MTNIFGPDGAWFDALTIKKAISNPRFHLIVGEMNGEFIACASIYYNHQVGRIDHVSTAPKYRKQGYSRELMRFLVEYHKKQNPDYLLYEWPANKTAEKIYYEAGFRYLYTVENVIAYID